MKTGMNNGLEKHSMKLILLRAAVLGVALVTPTAVRAACDDLSFHAITPRNVDNPAHVHIGDTVTVQGQLRNDADDCLDSWVATNAYIILSPNSAGCGMTNIPVTIFGVSNVVLIDTNVPTRTQTVVGIRIPPGGAISAIGSFVVPECDNKYSIVFNAFHWDAIDARDGPGNDTRFGPSNAEEAPSLVIILRPSIACTSFCTNGVGESGNITFGGLVLNSGNEPLTNVFVDHSFPTNHTPILGPITLLPGQSNFFSGSYYPSNSCDLVTDTITVRGTEENAGQSVVLSVTNTSSTLCYNILTPAISLASFCPTNPVQPGDALGFSGAVSNAGNVTLMNVVVIDSQPTNVVLILGPMSLAPGESSNLTSSYTVPPDSCGPYADTLIAYGTTICGEATTSTETLDCPGAHQARIAVSRNCSTNPVALGETNLISGVVSNAGNITLTNVTVIDNQAGQVLTNVVLSPGMAIAFSGSYVETNCGPNVAVGVTATGNDKCAGLSVSNRFETTCSVLCPPAPVVIFGATVNDGSFIFLFKTETNHPYTIQFSDSLSPVKWGTLTNFNFSGDGTVATIRDSITNTQGFYRVLVQ
jgi:uncharacterized repeat protein (TIGR01451 family)